MLTLGQLAVPAALDLGVMREHVRTPAILLDEAKPFSELNHFTVPLAIPSILRSLRESSPHTGHTPAPATARATGRSTPNHPAHPTNATPGSHGIPVSACSGAADRGAKGRREGSGTPWQCRWHSQQTSVDPSARDRAAAAAAGESWATQNRVPFVATVWRPAPPRAASVRVRPTVADPCPHNQSCGDVHQGVNVATDSTYCS
jgi:hypothetical protein